MPVSIRNCVILRKTTITTRFPSSHRPMNSASSSPNSFMLPSSNTISLSSQILSFYHAIFSLIHSPLLPNALVPFLLHIALLMGKKCLVVQKPDVPQDIIALLGCKSQEGGGGGGLASLTLSWELACISCSSDRNGRVNVTMGIRVRVWQQALLLPPLLKPFCSLCHIRGWASHQHNQLVLLPATWRQISGVLFPPTCNVSNPPGCWHFWLLWELSHFQC